MGLSTNKAGTGKPIYKAKDSAVEKTEKQAEFVGGKAVPSPLKTWQQCF